LHGPGELQVGVGEPGAILQAALQPREGRERVHVVGVVHQGGEVHGPGGLVGLEVLLLKARGLGLVAEGQERAVGLLAVAQGLKEPGDGQERAGGDAVGGEHVARGLGGPGGVAEIPGEIGDERRATGLGDGVLRRGDGAAVKLDEATKVAGAQAELLQQRHGASALRALPKRGLGQGAGIGLGELLGDQGRGDEAPHPGGAVFSGLGLRPPRDEHLSPRLLTDEQLLQELLSGQEARGDLERGAQGGDGPGAVVELVQANVRGAIPPADLKVGIGAGAGGGDQGRRRRGSSRRAAARGARARRG
jgi:hypothetical protein